MWTFTRKHPVAAYFALTFTISWGLAVLAVSRTGGMRGTTPGSDPRFAYALMAMLAGAQRDRAPPDCAARWRRGAS